MKVIWAGSLTCKVWQCLGGIDKANIMCTCFHFVQASLLMSLWYQVLMTCPTLIDLNQKRMTFVFQTFPPRTSVASLERAYPLWDSPLRDTSQTLEIGREDAPTIITLLNLYFHLASHVCQYISQIPIH